VTGRHSSFTAAHDGGHKHWNSIVLTSCELSILDLARAAKMDRQQGETLRLIDVPAELDGISHIFDRPPRGVNEDNIEDWKSRTFATIVAACEQNHGKPFRKYIKTLIAKRMALKEEVAKSVDHFAKGACSKSDGALTRDVARKFGLIYAGGLLGIQSGILPWTEKGLSAALTKSFRGTRDLLPDPGVLLRQGKIALKTLRASVPARGGAIELGQAGIAGFKEQADKQRMRYVIKWETFKNAFTSPEQQNVVIAWLINKGRVTLATTKKTAGQSSHKLKEQIFWPSGDRIRSIEIFWPRTKNVRTKGKKRGNDQKRRRRARKRK
jgi:hypothetical protein